MPRRPGGDRARVGRDDRVVGEQVVDVPGDDLRLERRRRRASSRVAHQLPPLLHAFLGRLEERAILLGLEQRQEGLQGRRASPTRPMSTG